MFNNRLIRNNTLALRGLEEPFFQLCCCVVSVFGSGGKKVLIYMHVLLRVEEGTLLDPSKKCSN